MISKMAPEGGCLDDAELLSIVQLAFQGPEIEGKRALFIIPDHTRSMPAHDRGDDSRACGRYG